MANTPRPTTSRRSVLSGAGLIPHADSHDINGADPVLSDIRLLGIVTSTTAQTITTTSSDGPDAWENITALVLPVLSRGGTLRITFGGPRTVRNTSTTENRLHMQFRPIVASTGLPQQYEALDLGTAATPAVLSTATFSSAMIWIYDVLPGVYTIQMQACGLGGVVSEELFIPSGDGYTAYLQVEELLPLRQG